MFALPGFGIVLELLPVFVRKPLWGYRLAVSGMLGVTLLSFFVWQHHLFVSGINADLRPFYMLSTEIISVPTGFIFLCFMGTLWKGRITFTVPMLFCLAWAFNFLIGGATGVVLSDVATDTQLHGSFFVLAHFHYTIMGGVIFPFFAAIYYWVPKMTGLRFNETMAKWHFWLMFLAFNSTFLPLFVLGLKGMPRRVSTYEPSFVPLNTWASISAFVLGFSMLIFIANTDLLDDLRAGAGRVEPVALAARSSGRFPLRCQSTTSTRSPCSTPTPTPTARRFRRAARSPHRRGRAPERWRRRPKSTLSAACCRCRRT